MASISQVIYSILEESRQFWDEHNEIIIALIPILTGLWCQGETL